MDGVDEISKGWISVERAFQRVKFGRGLDENGPVEIDTALMKPVLAYESTAAQRSQPEVVDIPQFSIGAHIRLCTDTVDDKETELCGEGPCCHVEGKRGSKVDESWGSTMLEFEEGPQLSLQVIRRRYLRNPRTPIWERRSSISLGPRHMCLCPLEKVPDHSSQEVSERYGGYHSADDELSSRSTHADHDIHRRFLKGATK